MNDLQERVQWLMETYGISEDDALVIITKDLLGGV